MTLRARAHNPLFVAAVFALLAGALLATRWLWDIDTALRSLMLRAFERPAPADVIIVAIDEDSLQALGDWPWPRRLHGRLIGTLSAAGAKAIGLGILFSESNRHDPDGDLATALAIAESGRVVLPVAFEEVRHDGQPIEVLPRPAFASAAAALGHVDVDIDRDGRTRSVFTFAGLGEPVWPTFALAMLRVGGDAPPLVDPVGRGGGGHGKRASRTGAAPNPFVWVRADPLIVPLAGPPGHFRRVSYAAVLAGEVPATLFRDAYVLVGATAATLGSRFGVETSHGARLMSGVELNANVLDTLRQGLAVRTLHEPYAAGIGVILVFLAGLLYRLRLSPGLALALGALAVAAVNLVALYGLRTWIAPAAPLAAIGAMFLFWRWLGLRQERRELATERTRSRATLHSITDGVVMIGRDGTVAQLNPVAQRLCALSAGEAAGRPVDAVMSFLGPERREPLSIAALLDQVARGQPCLERQAILRANNGDERAVQFSLALAHDRDGGTGEAILALSDTTDLQILARVIADQASRDELTGLPNRRVFSERLASALSRARLSRQAVALLVVDLDGFQRVNDAFGYEAGDGLLQAVAQRLRASRRPEHTLGRLGNDQFCVIVEDLAGEERLSFLAHRLRKAIAAPFVIQGFKVMTTVSVGIAVYPRDGDDVDSLLSSARCAAERAKRRGGNGVDLYSSEGRVIDLHHAKLAYNLKRALERNEMHLVYQPILDARRKVVSSVEALLRWRQEGQPPIDPGEFIPMLEDAGLVATVGEWVLRTACAQAQVWRRLGWDEARVSVNLSARQLLDPDLGETVRAALGASGLDAGAVCLEVTETAQITDLPQAAKIMAGLHDLGVRLAIDDFGVGYSSLMSLKRLPVDALKIDKSLIHEAAASDGDAAMMTAVVALAHAMGLTVIAEGIETEEQLRLVRAQNVDEVQGYLIGPPVEPDTVLSQWRATLRTA